MSGPLRGNYLPEIRLRCSIEPTWKLSMKSHQEESCGRCASTLTGVKIRQSPTWLSVSCICVLCLPMYVCTCAGVRACMCVYMNVCGGVLPRPAAVAAAGAAAGGNGLRYVQQCAHVQH